MARRTPTQVSSVSAALARDRLGIPAVVFFVLAGVAPLTVAAGVVPTAFAVTGLTGVPAAFLIVALVLGVFSVGYVAMARHISNAGAFYAFISRGLGRPVGVGAALIALAAYNLLQVGLYGAFGFNFASYAADNFNLHAAWWIWALAAWAVVTILGLVRVDLSGKVLGVLLSTELVVLIALGISGLIHPAHGHLSLSTLNPANLTSGGLGPVLAVAVLGYIGFEQSPVFAEEARNPRRTVPMATYLSLGLIAVVYAGASLSMAVNYGNGQVVGVAQAQGPAMLFAMGSGILPHLGRTLFLTSLFAAALAFHNACWRYSFALGRERVLPAALGRTGRSGVPMTASAVQSVFGLVVILVYAMAHWDPMVNLFFWLGTTGAVGILILLTVTSIAVLRYFWLDPHDEPLWRRMIAPGLAAAALLVMVWLCLDNFSTLLGVPAGSVSAKLLPAIFGVVAIGGIVWGLILKSTRPEVYEVIGLGANAATGRSASSMILFERSVATAPTVEEDAADPAQDSVPSQASASSAETVASAESSGSSESAGSEGSAIPAGSQTEGQR